MTVNGRPPVFSSEEDLQNQVDAYFNSGIRTKTIFVGKDAIPTEVPVPTITGLAIFLGFESRQSFYDYEKNPKFSYTIKKARMFIEREYEEQLQVGNTTGAIFALKNMGWIDRQHQDHTTNGKDITPPSWMREDETKP
jgi:hypothetical protein